VKDQYFNGVFVSRKCVFCSSHPMNATNTTGGTQSTDVQQLKAKIVVDLVCEVLSKMTMLSGQSKLVIAREIQQQLSAVWPHVVRNL